MPDKKRRAVITGLGPITAIGIGREEFWNGLRAEKSGVRTVDDVRQLDLQRALRRGNSGLGAGEVFPAASAEAARSLRAICRRLRASSRSRTPELSGREKSRSIASASASAPRSAESRTPNPSTRIF